MLWARAHQLSKCMYAWIWKSTFYSELWNWASSLCDLIERTSKIAWASKQLMACPVIHVWHPCSPSPWIWDYDVYHWIFVIADNSTPIIEANFLQEHGFLVNMRHGHYDEYVRVSSSKNTIFHLVSYGPPFQLQQSNRECGALMAEFPQSPFFCYFNQWNIFSLIITMHTTDSLSMP